MVWGPAWEMGLQESPLQGWLREHCRALGAAPALPLQEQSALQSCQARPSRALPCSLSVSFLPWERGELSLQPPCSFWALTDAWVHVGIPSDLLCSDLCVSTSAPGVVAQRHPSHNWESVLGAGEGWKEF